MKTAPGNSPKKKIYMAGCGGMLGEAFYYAFRDNYELKCTDIDVNEKWLSALDFRRYEDYKRDVAGFKPDHLFHIGAHTSLEYCELNVEDAYLTNTRSVERAVSIANGLDIPILYIGTAGIFDGAKECYDDDDKPNPLGHYARSKYEGELFVKGNAKRYLICRAGWMMGGGPGKDKKFVQKIMKQIKDGKRELHVVDDKLGTPTYTHDFAANVRLLVENGVFGLYNMVCEGKTSRMEVAREILKIKGLEKKIGIVPVSSDFFKKDFFAPRPDSECLINRRLRELGFNRMADWKTSLRIYLDRYYADYL